MMRTRAALASSLLLLGALPLHGQEPDPLASPLDTTAFRVFTGTGEPASLEALLAEAAGVPVVFLGESHNDRVGHRLQHEVLVRLLEAADRPVVLSLEMFERDVQYILDEYLAGLITADQFRRSTRPWPHYDEDYAPLVEAARTAGIPVLAANAPRRYVNLVGREGPQALERLSAEALRHLPPLPFAPPSDAYLAELRAIMGSHGDTTSHVSASAQNGFLAQALWDAAMAHSITEALIRRPDALVVHAVGSFHVRNGTGIPEHLERYRPGTRRLIVMIEPVDDPSSFPEGLRGTGDFVVLTDRSRIRAQDPPGGG